ncbi:MAG: thioredoxin-dependent thiol peroxidase [Gammaproteobacteria bacterium]|nr:thioredoxin-dependent thiol peroxidase [Gammaproteobacteria bacterium]HIJ26963.1 thioredoxin-dependent thiol peroxidase [Gammaproteobacteria bacterium]
MLETGETIPHFSKPDQEGNEKAFSDLTGEKGLILYFYPKDNTPGCTNEAKDFRDEIETFRKMGVEVVGVSKDTARTHTNFITKHELPFTLLSDSDPEAEMCQAFGVWQEKKNYGKVYMGIVRTTFLIDAKGTILKVYNKVRVKEHVSEVFSDTHNLLK